MKAKLFISFFAVSSVLVALALFCCRGRQTLPRLHLGDGTEFRVVQIIYPSKNSNESDAHDFGKASKMEIWIWKHLPTIIQSRLPYPKTGIGYPYFGPPALSIWWARINPKTRQPEFAMSGEVVMIQDRGAEINLGRANLHEGYQHIWIINPPKDSKHLTFKVPVEDETVEFTIQNPAYAP